MKRVILALSPLILAFPLALAAQQADPQADDAQHAPNVARQGDVGPQAGQAHEEKAAKGDKREGCDSKKKGRGEAEATSRTET